MYCFICHAAAKLQRYSPATTSTGYPSSIFDMYKMSICTRWHRWHTVRLSVVNNKAAVLSAWWSLTALCSLWCWHTFEPTNTIQLDFVMILPFHGAHSVNTHLPSLSISFLCISTPELAVYLLSATHSLLDLKQGLSWLAPEITVFALEFYISAASESRDVHLFPSLFLSISLPV